MAGFAFTVNKKINAAGLQVPAVESAADDMVIERATDVPVAQAGQLTLRSSGTAGTITMASGGHGINTADIVDIYWAGGYISGVVVGTVVGTAVPISGGNAEFALPPLNTQVVVGKVQLLPFVCTGNNNQMLAVGVDGAVESIHSFVNAGVVKWTRHMANGQGGDAWTIQSAWTNPIAGQTTTHVRVSHADVANVRKMQAVALTH